MKPASPHRINRRQAIQWMTTALAGLSLSHYLCPTLQASAPPRAATGYGMDPDLLKSYNPGDAWPLTFTAEQRRAVVALCDTILPGDAGSPSASSVGVHDFIDECVSSPYPDEYNIRPTILEGLVWLENEAQHRFGQEYAALTVAQQHALCDDICSVPKAKPDYTKAAMFFTLFRLLVMGGYYTTNEGMKDIGYIGNVPLPRFEGPPPELLQKLGLA